MKTNINRESIQAMSLSYKGTIRQAMQAIDQGSLGTALLVEPDTQVFVGLVTDGDIRRAILKGYGLESPISDVPRPNSKTARLGMSSEEVASLFSDPVRVIPLLDEHHRVADLAIFDNRMRLPVAEPSLGEKELSYVTECVLTGWVSSAGKFVTRFEEMMADFCGTRYAIATSSGTTALHLALLSLGIGCGDEVIVPSLTFIATANAVSYTGARPVFVDSETETWNLDPDLIEQSITPQTKAIIPVHLYGHPCNLDPILEIANRYNLSVIEDAAEAQGALYKGKIVGGIGDLGTFSFYGNKIITTGEGGIVVTNRSDLAEKVRILRDHGMSSQKRYWHPVLGYNYRMTNIQAALGVAQMERVDGIIAAKKRIAQAYTTGLQNVAGIQLPPEADWANSVFWLYSILIDDQAFEMDRDRLMEVLKSKNIETRPLFPPLHLQPIYNQGEVLPIAEKLSKQGLSLPSAISMSNSDIQRTIEAIIGK
ncbi:aminotransferase class I/II-fold pyridoxal phosphate-dependent enzyme [Picosynechococcus sp. PCC 7117]|uniref:aminotransferase class I/II-fold pyridoxal phosphate-dependent enzyme n=1 Tax=Picosynechococcus sp. PCC 7117 TaxID=195498 RepID=UPI0022B26019|nr:aminotransferase class I/II-fold pyridoxal phosphate-dependent enzyme [Picosynechococcus sp. PCC 7117]